MQNRRDFYFYDFAICHHLSVSHTASAEFGGDRSCLPVGRSKPLRCLDYRLARQHPRRRNQLWTWTAVRPLAVRSETSNTSPHAAMDSPNSTTRCRARHPWFCSNHRRSPPAVYGTYSNTLSTNPQLDEHRQNTPLWSPRDAIPLISPPGSGINGFLTHRKSVFSGNPQNNALLCSPIQVSHVT